MAYFPQDNSSYLSHFPFHASGLHSSPSPSGSMDNSPEALTHMDSSRWTGFFSSGPAFVITHGVGAGIYTSWTDVADIERPAMIFCTVWDALEAMKEKIGAFGENMPLRCQGVPCSSAQSGDTGGDNQDGINMDSNHQDCQNRSPIDPCPLDRLDFSEFPEFSRFPALSGPDGYLPLAIPLSIPPAVSQVPSGPSAYHIFFGRSQSHYHKQHELLVSADAAASEVSPGSEEPGQPERERLERDSHLFMVQAANKTSFIYPDEDRALSKFSQLIESEAYPNYMCLTSIQDSRYPGLLRGSGGIANARAETEFIALRTERSSHVFDDRLMADVFFLHLLPHPQLFCTGCSAATTGHGA
ncbi:hypothetical protein HGRIS_001147 [Hohenbuehelia grisea]|uniref:Uncharacterized protein n=1 Tax=Hohenbuehelia grisea TaxID=104357 RepID=A0ABR3JNZ9_9AGAR